MAKDTSRLARHRSPLDPLLPPTAPAPAAPSATRKAKAQPRTAPAQAPSASRHGVEGVPFTGLDPLSLELVEAAPLVSVSTPFLASRAPVPAAPAVVPARSPRASSPAVLVVLGGALASGLLFLLGTRARHSSTGNQTGTAAGVEGPGFARPVRAARSTPMAATPPNLTLSPAPAVSEFSGWTMAGGS